MKGIINVLGYTFAIGIMALMAINNAATIIANAIIQHNNRKQENQHGTQ